MAVRRNDIQKAVQVVIHKKTSECERLGRHLPDARSQRFIGEQTGAIVLIKRQAFVGKISDDEARKARAIEVGRVRAHAGAHSARVAEGDSDRHAYVGERSVVIVVIKLVRFGVIRDEEIHPTVAVVIEQRDAKRFARGIKKPSLLGDVFEDSVTFVVVEARTLAFVGLWRAVGLVLVVECTVLVLLDRPFDVVRNKKVELSVVVVVKPNGAGGKSRAGYTCFGGNVSELAVAKIVEEVIGADRRQIKIVIPIIVVVADGATQSIALDGQTGLLRHIRECS